MKRLLAMAAILLMASSALATTSSGDVKLINTGWGEQSRNDVLCIETTTSAIPRALNDLGVPFDYYYGDNFAGLDLTPYTHVFLCMDGGLVEEASIANAAAFVNGGGYFHIYGGTCWQAYAIAVNTHLIQNNINDYCWTTVMGSPDVTIVDAGHYLAAGLPGTYNFLDMSASYYQLRATDAALAVAAVNGDGYDMLFSKNVGAGAVDACINSSYDSYYSYPTDYDWLRQVVANMLALITPTESSSVSAIKALY